ncbi:hypothetical protein C9374_008180 [Naegleria lovaniensis]|uniref:Phytanoyl-CoA dioxygenase n=1 Tax=Naegleria lovaniensis TaxID=51637 RepID=A0AA88GJW6_NAELO|nr:uncharacterized protein C9374_008180 [Naegleria lovaniensis]KAG2378541.1 hypothetical protein C9374_008180 [Naegleria lovaniensis]
MSLPGKWLHNIWSTIVLRPLMFALEKLGLIKNKSNSSSTSSDRYSGIGSGDEGKQKKTLKIEFPILPVHPLPKLYDEKSKSYFVQDFDIDTDDPNDILKFFNDYGVVVFRNILSDEQIENSIQEVWEELEESENFKKHDPETWKRVSRLGILGDSVYWKKTGMENRQNEKLVRAFELLYGKSRSELWTSFDRVGVLTPTLNIPCPYYDSKSLPKSSIPHEIQSPTKTVDKEHLRTEAQWLHWDCNPFCVLGEFPPTIESEEENTSILELNPNYYLITENNGNHGLLRLQGVLQLSESREDDGGFLCVPGFHNHAKEYAEKLTAIRPGPKCTFLSVFKGDNLLSQTQKVPAKAGSLIVWNTLLPHANYPNHSDRFRICQYIKMIPKKGSESFQKLRATKIEEHARAYSFAPSETGKQVFGFELLDKYKQL